MAYTPDHVVQWAQQFFPTLKFSKGPSGENEAFYPTDADAWVTHRADPSVVPPPVANPKHRGTAVYRWRATDLAGVPPENWKAQLPRIAAGQIQLSSGPSGIGSAEFASRPPLDPTRPGRGDSNGDWYLDFGGWSDPAAKSYGQMGYTWSVFRQRVYDTLGLPGSSRPNEPAPDDPNPAPPASFTPNTQALHAYAEFAPVEAILSQLLDIDLPPELADLEAGQTKIQGLAERLKEFLGLSYYFFYPGYNPPDGKLMEGQWEAISLFLQDLGEATADYQFAAYSQGWAGGLFPQPAAACKAAGDIEKDGQRPVAYVAHGSHANYYTALNSEQTVDPGVNWGAVGGYSAAGGVAAAGVILIAAGLAATPIGWPAVIVGIILLVVAALIALFTWLFTKDDEAPAPPPYDEGPRNDTHSGDGAPAGGGAVGTNDPASPPPAPGTPQAGGMTPFMVHPISADPAIVDPRLAAPAWWSYVGRWGVCVDDSTAMTPADPSNASWSNSCWRRWPDGYTLTHRNVEAFVDYLTGEIDQKTKTSRT